MTDHIADLITQIQNAGTAGKETIVLPYSKLRHAVADVLKKEGYIAGVEKRGRKIKKVLEVKVAYDGDDSPRVHSARRVSKLSRRVYVSSGDIRPVRQGHGTLIVSTPEGVMTGEDAKKKGIGGEVLFEIW